MDDVDEMMTIGQFADATGLSVSALRFYAARGLLLPAVIDAANGYRHYRAGQVKEGMLIRDLRRLDMPIREIRRALELSEPSRQLLIGEHVEQLEDMVRRARTVAQTLGTDSDHEEPTVPHDPATTSIAIVSAADFAVALR